MDDLLRSLERRWRASQLWTDKLLYNTAMVRVGNIPPPDIEVDYLWDNENITNEYWARVYTHLGIRASNDLDEVLWKPVAGTLKEWFRRWYFPNGVGLSACYKMTDPLPGRAPIYYQIPSDRHEMEAVFFTYSEDDLEVLDREYRVSETRKVITSLGPTMPTPRFLSWSVSRFLLSDQDSLLWMLQVAALEDLDDYRKQTESWV